MRLTRVVTRWRLPYNPITSKPGAPALGPMADAARRQPMPWSNQGGGPWGTGGGGGGGGGKGPWGSGPQQSGPTPPDLEEFLRRSQDKLRNVLPGGNLGGKGLGLILLAAIAIWGLSG